MNKKITVRRGDGTILVVILQYYILKRSEIHSAFFTLWRIFSTFIHQK